MYYIYKIFVNSTSTMEAEEMTRKRIARAGLAMFFVGFGGYVIGSMKHQPTPTPTPIIERTDLEATTETTNIAIDIINPWSITHIEADRGFQYSDENRGVQLINAVVNQEVGKDKKSGWHAEAPIVIYNKKQKTITFESQADEQPFLFMKEETIKANRIILVVSDTNELENLEATGSVVIRDLKGCLNTTGEKLTIDYKNDILRLEGGPGKRTKTDRIERCESSKKEVTAISFSFL